MSVEEDQKVEGGSRGMMTIIVIMWMAYKLDAPWWIWTMLVIIGIFKTITITWGEDK